ncbi:MAG: protein kinase [Bryobacteraceae bacterium]|nr:protein kinase [Bryobacterales bacterium]NUN01809.1 protein kinase [Bryobacteraceae bacterium]
MLTQTVSRYEIQDRLGEGGMGVVHKAVDRKLHRPVALKFLPLDAISNPEYVQRFMQEAQVISALNHPSIATIYEFEQMENSLFLVLEYVSGGDLRSYIRETYGAGKEVPFSEVLRLAIQIGRGLDHAHRRGIVHRDIKSSNILLTTDKDAKITDFGLAKWAESSLHTTTGEFRGTLAYVAPEQAEGKTVDERADIFSFGVVLFELASGRRPFEGDTAAALLYSIATKPAPRLSEYRPDTPPEFDQIVARTLQKKPEDRYQSVRQLLEAMEAARAHLGYDRSTVVRSMVPAPLLAFRRSRVWLVALLLAIATASTTFLLAPSIRETLGNWSVNWNSPANKHLAILPFHGVGANRADSAFAEGLAEILANKLTQVEQLHGDVVVVSTAELRREGVTSPREARAAFGATLALAGSLQPRGDDLVLALSLVDTKSGLQLGARTLTSSKSRPAALEERAFEAIVELLRFQLRPESRKALHARAAAVPGAYDHYLQGRGYLLRFDRMEDVDRAIAAFNQSVAIDPDYALAYAGRAEAYWWKYVRERDSQLLERVREDCRRAMSLDGNLAAVHMTMGLVNTGTGRFAAAVDDFQHALGLEPANPDALRELGKAYDAMGETAKAEAEYRRAIDLRPNYWAGYKDLGIFHFKHGRHEQAEACFRRVIELTPDNYVGYSNLGAVLLKQGRYQEAAEALERSIAVKPTAKALSNLATLYYFRKQYAEAAAVYKQATLMTPSDYVMWGNLAEAYRLVPERAADAADAYRKAIEAAEQHARINPRDAHARALIAAYWSFLGDHAEAVRNIQSALELGPEDGFVRFRAAVVFENSGQREEALKQLALAISHGYSRDEIAEATPLVALRADPRYARLARAPDVVSSPR